MWGCTLGMLPIYSRVLGLTSVYYNDGVRVFSVVSRELVFVHKYLTFLYITVL